MVFFDDRRFVGVVLFGKALGDERHVSVASGGDGGGEGRIAGGSGVDVDVDAAVVAVLDHLPAFGDVYLVVVVGNGFGGCGTGKQKRSQKDAKVFEHGFLLRGLGGMSPAGGACLMRAIGARGGRVCF